MKKTSPHVQILPAKLNLTDKIELAAYTTWKVNDDRTLGHVDIAADNISATP